MRKRRGTTASPASWPTSWTTGRSRRELLDRLLTSQGIDHAWEAGTSWSPPRVEDAVDMLMGEVEVTTLPTLDPDAEKVVYEVGLWSDANRAELADAGREGRAVRVGSLRRSRDPRHRRGGRGGGPRRHGRTRGTRRVRGRCGPIRPGAAVRAVRRRRPPPSQSSPSRQRPERGRRRRRARGDAGAGSASRARPGNPSTSTPVVCVAPSRRTKTRTR